MNSNNYERKILPQKVFNIGLALLVTGIIILIANYIIDPHRAAFNNLLIYVFLVSLGVGSLAFVIVEYITGTIWSVPIRRIAEFMGGIIYILPFIAIPLLFNLHSIFHWTHEEAVQSDKILQGKAHYLNTGFFTVRTIGFILIWGIFYYLINRNSKKQDITKDQKLTQKNIYLSGGFIPVFIISITVTAIDWLMSIEPHWFSTIFGFYYFSGTVISTLALLTIIVVTLNEKGYLVKGITTEHYYSLGALMFAFVNFWAYIAFSQFLLIWYANLPEETFWMIMRWEGSWKYFTIAFIFIHFVIPYFALVSQPSKMNPKRLVQISALLLVAHFMDMYWLSFPTLNKDGVLLGIFELAAPMIIAGIVIVVLYLKMKNNNAVAIGDPKLKRGLEFKL